MRVEIREEPGCTIWEVTDPEGAVHYEVKCGVHRTCQFESEQEAHAHGDRWAPEVSNDLNTFERAGR